MTGRAHDLIRNFVSLHEGTTNDTAAALGDESFVFVGLVNDLIAVRAAVLEGYSHQQIGGSLVGIHVLSLDKDLHGLNHDFLLGRYAEAGRTLRFLWEQVFRAFHADTFRSGASADEKLDWLEGNERKLNWGTVVLPGLHRIWPTAPEVDLQSHFRPLWDRLNRVVHPSVELLRNGMEDSTRLVFNHFDEGLARQLISDAGEVVSLIWAVVLRSLPAIGTQLRPASAAFNACPQFRTLLG